MGQFGQAMMLSCHDCITSMCYYWTHGNNMLHQECWSKCGLDNLMSLLQEGTHESRVDNQTTGGQEDPVTGKKVLSPPERQDLYLPGRIIHLSWGQAQSR